jgi:hypothetical protein
MDDHLVWFGAVGNGVAIVLQSKPISAVFPLGRAAVSDWLFTRPSFEPAAGGQVQPNGKGLGQNPV